MYLKLTCFIIIILLSRILSENFLIKTDNNSTNKTSSTDNNSSMSMEKFGGKILSLVPTAPTFPLSLLEWAEWTEWSGGSVLHSHWSRSNRARLSLVQSFRVFRVKYFQGITTQSI